MPMHKLWTGLAGAAFLVSLTPALAQNWGRPEGYGNRRADVSTVIYNGGRFENEGRGQWVEYGFGQQVKARFEEMSRSADWVDLNDPARDIQVRLNFRARVILVTERGGPYRVLYPIQSMNDARPGSWRN
jgi:hypothetical protein